MTLFSTEDDVREFIRKRADAVWWVEAAKGGTAGMPDAFAKWGGRTGWIEAKLASMVALDGSLRMKAAPQQLAICRSLARENVPVAFLAGISGTNRAVVFGTRSLKPAGLAVGKRPTFLIQTSGPGAAVAFSGASGAPWEHIGPDDFRG